jgi:hypothetical protein
MFCFNLKINFMFLFFFSFFGLLFVFICVSVSASGFEGWWDGIFQYGLRCELDRRHMAIISLQPGVWKYFSNMGQA